MEIKNVLITGGTGSFGNAFVKKLLLKKNIERIVIFSRDDMKQWDMKNRLESDKRLRFFTGDVRDKDRLHRAFENIDTVVHAAAFKIVPTAEYDPFECTKTNILGAMNVVDVALDHQVKNVLALSTDKASSPTNLYGATKLVSDKIMIAANSYAGKKSCNFSVVRYGNVAGSRGSVIPFFQSIPKNEPLPITDERMTRFIITMDQATDFVLRCCKQMVGGETFIAKLPSILLSDLVKALKRENNTKIIGTRYGEKLHEEMISPFESGSIYEDKSSFIILPQQFQNESKYEIIKKTMQLRERSFSYNSKDNGNYLDIKQIEALIETL